MVKPLCGQCQRYKITLINYRNDLIELALITQMKKGTLLQKEEKSESCQAKVQTQSSPPVFSHQKGTALHQQCSYPGIFQRCWGPVSRTHVRPLHRSDSRMVMSKTSSFSQADFRKFSSRNSLKDFLSPLDPKTCENTTLTLK